MIDWSLFFATVYIIVPNHDLFQSASLFIKLNGTSINRIIMSCQLLLA